MMKRCPNQNCESAFLFSNDKTTCPFCHSRLVDNAAEPGFEARTVLPPDRAVLRDAMTDPGGIEFVREQFGTVECHGRIIEIDHQELFSSRRHKLLNALMRGEPYQFAHQTIEYIIRVENIAEGFSTEITDFCLFGSYLGRLQVGDEVIVRAKELKGRRVVKSIYNETTSSVIRPGLQIPADVIKGAFLIAAVILTALICGLIWLLQSGAMAAGLAAVTSALTPVIIVCIGFWLLIRSVFPRRRR